MSKPGAANGTRRLVSSHGVEDLVAGIDVLRVRRLGRAEPWCDDSIDACADTFAMARRRREAESALVGQNGAGRRRGVETRRATIVIVIWSAALLTPSGTFVTSPSGQSAMSFRLSPFRSASVAVVPTPAPLPIVRFAPTLAMWPKRPRGPLPTGSEIAKNGLCDAFGHRHRQREGDGLAEGEIRQGGVALGCARIRQVRSR